jgi:cytoskeletal protein RodZ
MVTKQRRSVTMHSNDNNNRERRRPFFAWANRGNIVYSPIIALSLLASISFVLLSPPPMMMTTTIAAAQEEESNNNNSATTEATTATTTDGDTNTSATTTGATPLLSSSGIHLSPQPIWKGQRMNTGVAPLNQTHSLILFFGNATLFVPDTGETINVTNNGTAISSSVTGTTYGRESVFSENGDSTAITFYEIMKTDPITQQTRGIMTAVFDRNATGSLATFNGMIVVGLHDEQPNEEGVTMTLWKWED